MIAFVYAIGPSPEGPLKIGYATNLASRLSDIQVGNHNELHIYGLGQVTHQKLINTLTAKKAEGALHRSLKGRRIRGEWFDISADELAAKVADMGFVGGKLTWKKQA